MKNFIHSGISISSKLASNFFLFLILARILGVETFGILGYTMVIGSLVGMIVDFGFQLKLARDCSIDRDNIETYVTESLQIKLLISAVSIPVIILLSKLGVIDSKHLYESLLFVFMNQLTLCANSFLIPFRILSRFDIEAKYTVLNNFTVFILAIATAYFSGSILLIALSFFIGKALFVVLSAREFYKFFPNYSFISSVKNGQNKISDIIKASLPFAMHTIIAGFYLNVDTIILKHFRPEYEIGIYQAGIKLLLASALAFEIVGNVFLPRIGKEMGGAKFGEVVRKYNLLTVGIGVIISATMWIGNELIISIIYGDKFAELSNLLPILSLIVFLRYFGAIHGYLLTLSNKQTVRVASVFSTLVFILVADFFIIPIYGMYGAAIVLFFAHILLDSLYFFFVYREFGGLFMVRGDS